ncbi:MAG: N-acetylmuramoyl-L-alanine amidase, partial [Myxococcota bacterium]
VLGISKELSAVLEESGTAKTLLTREGDATVALEERAELANLHDAALFVSIHANASPNPKNAGVETFFLSMDRVDPRHRALVRRENEGHSVSAPAHADPLQSMLHRLALDASHHESQRLAIRLHDELARSTPYRARGVMQAPFVVLKGAKMAAALVEVGFLTHPTQCRKLKTQAHQRTIATQIAGGIIAHLRATDLKRSRAALTR